MDEFEELEPDESEFDNKYSAAVHEAGHVVVAAIHEGRFYSALIHPTNTKKPRHRTYWGGRMYGIDWAQGGISAATAVAGVTAEVFIAYSDPDAELCLELVECRMFEMSATDLRGYPSVRGEQLRAFGDALAILRARRDFFDWAVNGLLNNSGNQVPANMVEAYLESRKP